MNEIQVKWEDVPVLLCSILQELRTMNGKPAMPMTKEVVIEQRTVETVETEKPQTAETEQTVETGVTHEELKALCLVLNRKDPANKDKITAIIAGFTDGKLANVPVAKLSDLKAQIEALNNG